MEIQNGNLYIKIVQPLKTVLNVAQNKIDDRKKKSSASAYNQIEIADKQMITPIVFIFMSFLK